MNREELDILYRRRSIRKYTGEGVDTSTLEQVIRAGMNAPSAGNQQPWEFVIIDDRQILHSIPDIHPHARMVPESAAAILVCADLSREEHQGYWVQDCAACTQNMLLAATALNLGSVWLGVYPRQERIDALRERFNIPEGVVPFSLVALGVADEEKPSNNRFHPERIHRNEW